MSTVVQKTLEDYQIEHKVLPDQTKDSDTVRGTAYRNNLFISEANDYTKSYAANEYLLKADTTQGQKLIRSLYNVVPDGTEYIYMLYTNTIHGINLNRMVQHIWAFPSIAEVSKFLSEMIEELSWANNSHLVQLPVRTDLHNIKDQFIDQYYYNDFKPILHKTNSTFSVMETTKLAPVELKAGMTIDQVGKIADYNSTVFNLATKVLHTGLTKAISSECERLVERRSKLTA